MNQEYQLQWHHKNQNTLISNSIQNYRYEIVQNDNTFTIQEFFNGERSPESALVDNLDTAKFLAQSLADDILIID